MNAVIIDDEAPVRNTIKTLIEKNFPGINLVASAGSINEGYETIERFKPELVFLDIEFPDGTGFDLLKRFSRITFKIIFVTGHNEYAIDAIKVSALDYILKPIDEDEFCDAVIKAREAINQEDHQLKFQALNENLKGKKVLKRVILKTAEALQLISVSDIIRAEAESNYTSFVLTNKRHILVSRTLKEFDELLSGSGMIRVHQSHLVNLSYIDRFVKTGGGYLVLKDGSKIPVSPNLKKQVLGSLTNYLYE